MYNKYTDWDAFREILEEHIDMKIQLKSPVNIEEAVASFTEGIQQAAWLATPPIRSQHVADSCPLHIK